MGMIRNNINKSRYPIRLKSDQFIFSRSKQLIDTINALGKARLLDYNEDNAAEINREYNIQRLNALDEYIDDIRVSASKYAVSLLDAVESAAKSVAMGKTDAVKKYINYGDALNGASTYSSENSNGNINAYIRPCMLSNFDNDKYRDIAYIYKYYPGLPSNTLMITKDIFDIKIHINYMLSNMCRNILYKMGTHQEFNDNYSTIISCSDDMIKMIMGIVEDFNKSPFSQKIKITPSWMADERYTIYYHYDNSYYNNKF